MRRAFVNARLLDPASGLDIHGGLLVIDEAIADRGAHVRPGAAPHKPPAPPPYTAHIPPATWGLDQHMWAHPSYKHHRQHITLAQH